MAIDYTLGKGESIAAYNARIADARKAANTQTAPAFIPVDTSTLTQPQTATTIGGYDVKTLMDRINTEMEAVSSAPDEVSSSINEAIESQRSAAESNKQYLESMYGRESGYLLEKLTNERTSILEGGRGNAVGAHALGLVDKEIDKSLRDLDQRKNELILQGNAAAASKISDLQLQQLQLKSDAQQRRFTNLLGLGNMTLSIASALSEETGRIRSQTMEQLRYNMELQSQKDYREHNAKQLGMEQARLLISQRELDLRTASQARETKLDNIPAPGFLNMFWKGHVTKDVIPQLIQITNTATTEADSEVQLAALEARTLASWGNVAEADAIHKMIWETHEQKFKQMEEETDEGVLTQWLSAMGNSMVSGYTGGNPYAPKTNMFGSSPADYPLN